jgi:hypothetical protein
VELGVTVAMESTRSPPCSATDVSSSGVAGNSRSPGLELALVGLELSRRGRAGTQHQPSDTNDEVATPTAYGVASGDARPSEVHLGTR